MSSYLIFLSFLFTASAPVVDSVRNSLETTSNKWFIGLLISTAVVAVGCILEIGETWTDLRRWFRLKRGLPVAEDNPLSWHVPAGAIGLMLVIIGVISEGVFEAYVSKSDTDLRSHDEQILTDATLKAAFAKDSAELASVAAGRAKDASGKAVESASSALSLAGGARKEADSFEAGIVSATKQAADAESHLAEALERANRAEKESIQLRDILSGWQLDDEAKKRFVKQVQKFAGTPFDLAVNPAEAPFMEELDGLLTSSSVGWVRLPPKPDSSGVALLIDGKASIILSSGIVLEVDQDQIGSLTPVINALGTALHDELAIRSVPLHLVPPGSWGKRIHIIIGRRQ